MPADIDQLTPTKGLIDLDKSAAWEASILAEDYIFNGVFGDVIFAEYVDLTEDGAGITRGGLIIPENAADKAWRVARAVLVGPEVKDVSPGDVVLFPNDRGMRVENFEVKGRGVVKSGVFLNEQRLFGKCSPREDGQD